MKKENQNLTELENQLIDDEDEEFDDDDCEKEEPDDSDLAEIEEEFDDLDLSDINIDAADAATQSAFGLYVSQIAKYQLLTKAQEQALAKRIEQGDELAKEEMINSNLRLVIAIAKHFANRGMDIMDLIQEGNLGLMKAIEKFDYTKDNKLSTYATWWIKQSINRALADKGRTIRMPVHIRETMSTIRKAKDALCQNLNRGPTVEEISEYINQPEKYSVERINDLIRINDLTTCQSLDNTVSGHSDTTFHDVTADENETSVVEYVNHQDIKDLILEALEILPDRQKQIIILRYGLDGQPPMSLEEIGNIYHITRERVRQLEEKSLGRLSHNKALKDLLSQN